MKTNNSLSIANPYTKVEILTNRDLEALLDRFPDIGVPTGAINKTEKRCIHYYLTEYYFDPVYENYYFEEQKVYIREIYTKLADIQVKAAQATDLGKAEASNLIELGKSYKARFMDALIKLVKDHKEAVALMQKAEDDKVLEKVKAQIAEMEAEQEKESAAKELEYKKKHRRDDIIGNIKAIIGLSIMLAIGCIPLWLRLGGVI